MSEQSNQPQDEAERLRQGAERLKTGPEDVPEVEGHIRRTGPEQAFGTEGAAAAERRPEDEPDPADGRMAQ